MDEGPADPGPAADPGLPADEGADEGAPDPGPIANDEGPELPEPADIADDIEPIEDTPVDSQDVEETIDAGPPPPPFWEDLPAGYDQAHFEELEVDLDGKTGDVNLIVPDNSLSTTVLLSGGPKDVWMRISKMVVPPGFPVVKSQGNVTCITCPNRVYASQILNTSLFPNTPDVQYKTQGKYKLGLWQFTVTAPNKVIVVTPWSGNPLTARVLFKHWPHEEPPTSGVIDLNLFFTGAGELTAETAETSPLIASMLEQLNTAYAQAGITVGEVRYFDTPEETPATVETTIAVDSDLSLLFQTSVGAPPGINVFFVEQILREELEDEASIVLGIAGGIPGPPFVAHGTPHSGVALALADIGDNPALLGNVLAHELGHYLGLFHTTEKTETNFDPISDTPEGTGENMMFWAANGEYGISEGQAFVMLRHPSVWLDSPGEPDPEPEPNP